MRINEVCRRCALTRKAVLYYVEQGLISPAVEENGYRDFSEADVADLNKIAVLRKLGLSVADISEALSGGRTIAVLKALSHKNLIEQKALQEKQELITELAEGQDWERIQEKLRQLERRQTILERLLQAFPGNYGRYICLHFARYLNEPVVTEEQQAAYDTIITFLDTVDFDISEELRQYIDEAMANCDEAFMERLSVEMDIAVRDMEEYLAEHRESIEAYMAFKQSEEYRNTPAFQLEQALRKFQRTSGYEEVFLPAMRVFSSSYREYREELMKADEVFLRKYPNHTI